MGVERKHAAARAICRYEGVGGTRPPDRSASRSWRTASGRALGRRGQSQLVERLGARDSIANPLSALISLRKIDIEYLIRLWPLGIAPDPRPRG
jgi:hypothetical protein